MVLHKIVFSSCCNACLCSKLYLFTIIPCFSALFLVSGYDFGYLVKLLTDARLPEEEHEFFQILNLFFPAIYDVKYLMKSCKNLKVGSYWFSAPVWASG